MNLKALFIIVAALILSGCSKSYQNKFYKENGFLDNSRESSAPNISLYEVTNKQFRTFLKEDDNKRFNYDSTQWGKVMGIDFKFYNFHPAYDNFPVVNISYEAAEAYCNWLSKKYRLKSKNANANYDIDGCLITCPVNKFKQHSHYSILGNVSELCQGGIIKGGNWFTLPSEILLNKLYELPDPRVGFRIVLETSTSKK